MAMAVFACVSQSVISVASRRLKSIYFAIIQFNYSLMATISMGVFLVVACIAQKHVPYVYSSGWIYLEVFAAAVANMVGQNIMTISNQYANPATVGLITYMGVLYNFLVDLYIFDIAFTELQLLGVGICLSFSVAAAIYKIRIEQEKEKVSDAEQSSTRK